MQLNTWYTQISIVPAVTVRVKWFQKPRMPAQLFVPQVSYQQTLFEQNSDIEVLFETAGAEARGNQYN